MTQYPSASSDRCISRVSFAWRRTSSSLSFGLSFGAIGLFLLYHFVSKAQKDVDKPFIVNYYRPFRSILGLLRLISRSPIEFSAVARQCLNRRIPTIEQLEKEVIALVKERDDKKIKINWQFSIEVARDKMNNRYQTVLADNIKLKNT